MRRKIVKSMSIVYLLTMMLTLVSCENTELENDPVYKETLENIISNEERSTSGEQETKYVNTTMNNFASYGSIVEQYEFKLTYDEKNISQSVYEGKSFNGQAQLQADGDVLDVYILDDGSMNIYMEIEGVKHNFMGAHIENVAVIDVDSKDKFKEVAVFDIGLSGDPTMYLFRYIDGTIYRIGTLGGSNYEKILFDGAGKIIDGDAYVDFVEPNIVTEYIQIVRNEMKSYKLDCSEYLNKKYTLSKNIMVAFQETEDKTVRPDVNDIITLEDGTEITLIEIDPINCLYYVELSDGKRGTMTTQLAG